MVSKIAVMALVGILAIPILLGYGMNLTETTETVYTVENDSVNVTPLLQNGIRYSNIHADLYQINSNFLKNDSMPIQPEYNKINTGTSNSSATPMKEGHYKQTIFNSHSVYSRFYLFAVSIYYDPDVSYVSCTIEYGPDNTSVTIDKIKYMYYDGLEDKVYFETYLGVVVSYDNPTTYAFSTSNSNQYIDWYEKYILTTGTHQYADISAGYYFIDPTTGIYKEWDVEMPNHTKSILVTLNLDSITDSNYFVRMGVMTNLGGNAILLEKTTTGGVVSWQATLISGNYPDYTTEVIDLYYDPSRSDNTYQISFSYGSQTRTQQIGGMDVYTWDTKTEINYVGSWPKIMGAANVYQKYTVETELASLSPGDPSIRGLSFDSVDDSHTLTKTPTVRVDDAYLSGFEYPVIKDQTYTPSDFKTNPSTKLSKITIYGNSITFGGQTYNVGSDGNIMLGSHKASIDGMVFDSVPITGGYNNRINGVIINTSLTPSTLTFNGIWDASVVTDSLTSTTKTSTEWIPGQFAWNGIDQNFLMVGLMSVMGVFVAVGIYARIHRMSIWPLLFVCGGAAALFLFML